MLKQYESVYVTGTGMFLPGTPVDNNDIDKYIAPLNKTSGRIKNRILAENGIKQRYYAIDEYGNSLFSSWNLAANAIKHCLDDARVGLDEITLLCSGSSGGDTAMPGFANMVQGELSAPPMATSSIQGVCSAGVIAMQNASNSVELGTHQKAIVVASEFASRMFKKSRFEPQGYNTDFNAHFLRWMLSDGAGAILLSNTPSKRSLSLRVKWIHSRSFSGDYPVCMQIGYGKNGNGKSYLDYPSVAEAEVNGAFCVRQDIRLLPNLFDIGIHEYVKLVREGYIHPDQIDYFLCHYSSEKFAGVVADLMDKANLTISKERWYSNLANRGNTGAASIFIMLADFMREKNLKDGDRIFCFVPESGRFTVSYILLEVVDKNRDHISVNTVNKETSASIQTKNISGEDDYVPPPVAADNDMYNSDLGHLLTGLAAIWHDYRSRAWRSKLINKITKNELTRADYLIWMSNWIPQVREGSKWMREAIGNLDKQHNGVYKLISEHAADEQFDFQILFNDYKEAGGAAETIQDLRRNPGGEALNSYMFSKAGEPNPVGLLGSIYIIEGTGQRIIPVLLPRLKRQLGLPDKSFRFLTYHGENDVKHLERWLAAVTFALNCDTTGSAADKIIKTAKETAELYLLQINNVLP